MLMYFRMIGGFDLKEKLGRVVRTLGLYLDDLLLLAGGGCFVQAALDLAGRSAALATAGVCLTVYAVVVARSRGGGRK